jgi:hypothetical protein
MVNGNLLCPKTPCTKELSLGNHRVQMQAERYHPGEERVSISGDQTVTLSLNPTFGVLKVVTDPGDLQVQINGEVGGQGSFSKELPAGRYEVIVESSCLVRTGEVVALQEGQTRTVRISPPKRMAGLDIRAEDSAGNAQRGAVFADGVKVGETPGRFEVPLCIKDFRVDAGSNGDWTGQIALVEGAVVEKRVVLKRVTVSKKVTVFKGPAVTVDGNVDLGPADIDVVVGEAQGVSSVVKRYKNRIKLCYDQALRQDPNLQGRVEIKFSVGRGRVLEASISTNTMRNDALANCILRKVKGLTFDLKVEADVIYPFILSSKKNPPAEYSLVGGTGSVHHIDKDLVVTVWCYGPSGSTAYLNGSPVCAIPGSGTLPVGKHTFRVVTPDRFFKMDLVVNAQPNGSPTPLLFID